MLPNRVSKMFRSLVTLRVLNVLAVGFSLAAATGSVWAQNRAPTLVMLFLGPLWAWALPRRAMAGKTSLRSGWLWVANVVMIGTAYAFSSRGNFHILDMLFALFVGGTFTFIVTHLCFFLPIIWSQWLAEEGLAGEEKGEIVVGAASAIIAIGAALFGAALFMFEPVVAVIALIGAVAGTLAAILAFWRSRARRAFVREVEAGKITNFRVDAIAAGKVLVRVTPASEGYRAANFEEPIVMLDDLGNAAQPFANASVRN